VFEAFRMVSVDGCAEPYPPYKKTLPSSLRQALARLKRKAKIFNDAHGAITVLNDLIQRYVGIDDSEIEEQCIWAMSVKEILSGKKTMKVTQR